MNGFVVTRDTTHMQMMGKAVQTILLFRSLQ